MPKPCPTPKCTFVDESPNGAYPLSVAQDDDGDVSLTQPGANKHPDYILISRQQAAGLRDALSEWLQTSQEG